MIIGNEGGNVFIDATLLQELVEFILDTNIKLGPRTEKVSPLTKAEVKSTEKSTAGQINKPRRFRSVVEEMLKSSTFPANLREGRWLRPLSVRLESPRKLNTHTYLKCTAATDSQRNRLFECVQALPDPF